MTSNLYQFLKLLIFTLFLSACDGQIHCSDSDVQQLIKNSISKDIKQAIHVPNDITLEEIQGDIDFSQFRPVLYDEETNTIACHATLTLPLSQDQTIRNSLNGLGKATFYDEANDVYRIPISYRVQASEGTLYLDSLLYLQVELLSFIASNEHWLHSSNKLLDRSSMVDTSTSASPTVSNPNAISEGASSSQQTLTEDAQSPPSQVLQTCDEGYPCQLVQIIDKSDWNAVLSAIAFANKMGIKEQVSWKGKTHGHKGYILWQSSSENGCNEFDVTSEMGSEKGSASITACQKDDGSTEVR